MSHYCLARVCLVGFWIIGLGFLVAGQRVPENGSDGPRAKKPGVRRVGILLPTVTLNNAGDKVDPGEAVRNSFRSLLASGSIEIVPLEAKLMALALKEATDLNCDHVLRVSVTQHREKNTGFLNKVIDRAADSAINQSASKIPRGRTVPGSIGRETVVGIGDEATQIEFTVKNKDEFALEYKISTPRGQTVASNTLKVRAKRDNDDVLVPLIERAAEEVAMFLLK